jgi:hypothetical protein
VGHQHVGPLVYQRAAQVFAEGWIVIGIKDGVPGTGIPVL